MSATSKDEWTRLERFDGTQPSTYRKWRRKAELMIMALPNTYSKEKWGAKLMEFLSGEAEEVCEAIPLEKLIKEGGHELVFQALDAKYKQLQKDALHNHLQEYFYGISIKQGETYRNLMVRLETAYRRLQEHSVELPDEVKGWFLLRKLNLDVTSEAMVLTHTKGSLKYPDITGAVQSIFPQGTAKTGGAKVREVFEATEADDGKEIDGHEESIDEVFQAVADQVQQQEEYDDEDALEVCETYKDVRRQMQQRKLGRGYKNQSHKPEWTLTGTVKGKIAELKAKTKCHICHERGHWKKECPRKKKGGGSEAMVAENDNETWKDLGDEFFIDEGNIDQLEVFLAEHGGQVDVVLAARDESVDQDGQVRGDFEQGLLQFFADAQSSGASASDAYMADLACHGVPDTACRRTLIGESVLGRMSGVLSESGLKILQVPECHEFRFGNAGVLKTNKAALIPISLGGRQLAIKAAVLPGSGAETPLLLSKELLRGLHAKLDMEKDALEVGKYGVTIKLKETEKGHYALPLFEGMKAKKQIKLQIEQNLPTETHEVNAVMCVSAQAQRDIEPEQVAPEAVVEDHELHGQQQRCANGRAIHQNAIGGESHAGLGSSPRGGRGGNAGSIDSGCLLRSQRRRARRARQRANRRNRVQCGEVREGQDCHNLQSGIPHRQEVCGMGEKVCQGQGSELQQGRESPNDGIIPAVHRVARSDEVQEGANGYVSKEAEANYSNKFGKGNSDGSKSQVGPSEEQSNSARHIGVAGNGRGAHHRGAPSSTTASPDRGDDPGAGGAGGDVSSSSEVSHMTKAERKLCRRGIERCSELEGQKCHVEHGTDVLFLEQEAATSVFTAVGFQCEHVFPKLSPSDVRSGTRVQSALECIRQERPKLLVIRTPKHMSRTVGDVTCDRVFDGRQKAAFTRLVAACCAEQSCEGRLFCVEEENESLSERVRGWMKLREEQTVKMVERESGGSVWRMYTNCRQIHDRSKKNWITAGELRDKHCFQKDVAAGLLEHDRSRDDVFVSHCVYTIENLRGGADDDERKIMVMLKKLHENLGHPSVARMNILLKAAHASDKVLQLARGLTCETCQELSKPKSHHVAKIRRAVEFNQQVCVDTFELEVRGEKLHFLNVVDEATGFQMATPLFKGMQAKHVRNAYRKSWKKWAGPPIRLFCDGGKEFEGEFEHGLSMDGTYCDTSAAYAPWQNGLVEKRGDVWKVAFNKAQLELRPRSKQEVQELVDQINNAVNSMTRKDGYAPNQHVFGKDMRMPGMISSEPDPVINSSLVQGESLFERRMEIRTSARKAFLEADGEMRIRKSLEHRTRPERGPFNEGDLVFFWRKNRFDSKHHWHGPGVVIGKSGGSKVWIARGTKVYRCCPEQLRRLSPDQEAMIRLLPVDMIRVRDAVGAQGAGNYHDLSMLERPSDHEVDAEVDAAPSNQAVSGSPDTAEEPARLPAGSGEVDMEGVEESMARPVRLEHEDPRAVAAGDESPTKRARVGVEPTPLVNALRFDPELLEGSRPRASQVDDPVQIPVPDSDGPDEELEVLVAEVDHWVVDHKRSKLIRMHVLERDRDFVPCCDKLPVRVEDLEDTCVVVMFDRQGMKHRQERKWRDSSSLNVGQCLWTGMTEFSLKRGWQWQTHELDECFEVEAKKGRKEVNEKLLDPKRAQGLKNAKVKEWKKLVDSGAIVVHRGKAAARIREQIPKKRLLKSRFVVTEADEGTSPNTADLKARWCIRGYLDPDVVSLDTSSPTLSAEGLAVALQLAASCKWRIQIADVEGAFLRGDKLHPSRGRLFIELPPGGVEGVDETCIVEAVKTVYGLADAPKAWWQCFSKKLIGLGLRPSRFDPCVYYYFHDNVVAGVVTLHVDDLCMAGNALFESHVVGPLKEMYPFKHWKVGEGEFLGKYLKQEPDGSIKITQHAYAQQFRALSISRERRRNKSDAITEEERTQMRGALGGLNWLATGSRPDLAAWCSLLQQRVNSAVVQDLIDVNRVISMAHDNSSAHIWIRSIPVQNVQFTVLTDAAWANGKDCCSQAGYMVAACDAELPGGKWGVFSIMRWRSYKQDRQTHSTLGAELLSLSRGLAEARWIRSMWCEAMSADYELRRDHQWSCRIPLTAVIDCKPVYDHAHSETVSIKDKRMAIEMLLLKEDIAKYNISLRWMATKQMIVDVLTKKGAPMNLFRKVVQQGKFVLIEDEAVEKISSKRKS